MAIQYTSYHTKGGEMLDQICWKHYGQRSRMTDAALGGDGRLAGTGKAVREAALSMAQYAPGHMRGLVEAVLEANPGLAARGEVLPAGIEIRLPELEEQIEDTDVIRLWDD